MNSTIMILVLLLIVLTAPALSQAQGEAAVSFLTFPPSPEGNGMGGIVGSTISDNPMATLANPGQLGMLSLNNYFVGGFYPSSTTWLPGILNSDITYTATAFNAGVQLNRFTRLPLGLSIGLGYSHIGFDQGIFGYSVNDPTILSYFKAEEHTNNLSIGVGVDYFVKVGAGYTLKNVESDLAPINVQAQGRQGVSSFSTFDVGMIAEVPVTKVIGTITGAPLMLSGTMEPQADISLGYARRNLGNDPVVYIDAAQGDPLPRNAMLGITYRAGMTMHTDERTWDVISLTLAREAEDLLVRRYPGDTTFNVAGPGTFTVGDPTFRFERGAGAIQFVNNVLLGEGNNHITLRKGWQISLLELVQVRGGSVRGRGISYSTSGYGVRLAGIFHLLNEIIPTFSSTPFSSFVLSHIDIRYDHATSDYDDKSNLNDGVTFSGLSLVVK